ncbi:winged helix DNA-binding domain-containing protein [Rubrobacter tropicus]|uniref:winged helix DNA-binding domain-containing protein n=1 Tax=Rubrobacter tropicus TaxID=2653851 RepID=UPI00140E4193|nr:winged helix DNA-binding domain-containing protein [Rubrobacter tropicus]
MSAIQEQAGRWSYDRQRLGHRSPDVEAALRAVVGVYSSHPSAPLSLRARAKGFTTEAFRRLDADRRALRLPAMRGSIHLLPRETAHLAFRAAPEPPSGLRQRLKYFGIAEDRYPELREAALAAADEPSTARDLGQKLREATGYDGSPTPVLSGMAREGVLLRVGAEGPRSNALRYVATQTWLGDDLPAADADKALAWLAGEYLRAFGPARPEDFRWWAGVSKGRAAAALETVETIELEDGHLLPYQDLQAFEAAEGPGPDAVDVLPKWDCYTMGYAPDGRERFVHPDVRGRVYTPAGDGLGVVLVGGTAVGAWEARFSGKVMEARLDMFERPGARLKRILDGRFGEIAVLLGAREIRFA